MNFFPIQGELKYIYSLLLPSFYLQHLHCNLTYNPSKLDRRRKIEDILRYTCTTSIYACSLISDADTLDIALPLQAGLTEF